MMGIEIMFEGEDKNLENKLKTVFEEVINKIPDYKTFLTVEEMEASTRRLKEKYPELVEVKEIGQTREGEPIHLLKIGQGKKNALLMGSPHPNEPMGCMMLEFFTEELCQNKALRDSLDFTFYIIKCWDIDGTKLNENWFKGPFTLYHYARNFFRPAGHQQVDWTFPLKYKDYEFTNSLPETKAVQEMIDDIKPDFLYPIHNSGFGGVYWYLTDDMPRLYDALHKVPEKHGIPLHLGEPESAYSQEFAKAIYRVISIKDDYDQLEKSGVDNPGELIGCGTSSADYASKYGTFMLITECPYFIDDRISDLRVSTDIRRDLIIKKVNLAKQVADETMAVIKSHERELSHKNPFKIAMEAFHFQDDAVKSVLDFVNGQKAYGEKATIAEKFDNELVSKFHRLLTYALLIRTFEFELANASEEQKKRLSPSFERVIQQYETIMKKESEELEKAMNYRVTPIKKLVAIQLESALLVMSELQKQ